MDNTNTGNKFGNRRSSEQGSHLPDLSVAHYYVTRSTCARTLEPLPEIVEGMCDLSYCLVLGRVTSAESAHSFFLYTVNYFLVL